MTTSRRDFLKSAGVTISAIGLWPHILEQESAVFAAIDSEKDKLAEIALSTAKKLGAAYADIRINHYRQEAISTRERQVQNVARNSNSGFGIRVLVNGTWGFAASPKVTKDEVRSVAAQAIEIAKANSEFQQKKIELVPVKKATANWKSAFEKDPFEISIDEKIQMLMKINETALGVKGVSFVNSGMSWVNEQKYLATSEGSRIEQYIIRGFPRFTITAVDSAKGDFQTRDSIAGPKGIGYEYMNTHDWLKEARQAGEEAVMKLKAKSVDPGLYDLILDPTHLFLTIHESVGHSTELDRALWWEANLAGTSFLTPEKTGKLQFGSKIVNFFADRTQPHGLATVAYDDEAVEAQKWYLVKDGVFVDWQTTRDLAHYINKEGSRGCLYADSWSSVPFPRMPNVSLEAAKDDVKTEDLISEVKNGVMIYGRGSYSIDQQRYNFQFGGQTFWEIKDGKVGGMLRDVAYQSRTTDFWNACDGLGGKSSYMLPGTFFDGKGEPGQINSVSHGCPVARFRKMNVLNTAAKRS